MLFFLLLLCLGKNKTKKNVVIIDVLAVARSNNANVFTESAAKILIKTA